MPGLDFQRHNHTQHTLIACATPQLYDMVYEAAPWHDIIPRGASFSVEPRLVGGRMGGWGAARRPWLRGGPDVCIGYVRRPRVSSDHGVRGCKILPHTRTMVRPLYQPGFWGCSYGIRRAPVIRQSAAPPSHRHAVELHRHLHHAAGLVACQRRRVRQHPAAQVGAVQERRTSAAVRARARGAARRDGAGCLPCVSARRACLGAAGSIWRLRAVLHSDRRA